MRSEFHYPRAAVPMMSLIFACIVVIIYKARAIQISADVAKLHLDPLPYMVPVTIGLALLIACVTGALGWFILHWLHKSGVHKLSEAQTWPDGK